MEEPSMELLAQHFMSDPNVGADGTSAKVLADSFKSLMKQWRQMDGEARKTAEKAVEPRPEAREANEAARVAAPGTSTGQEATGGTEGQESEAANESQWRTKNSKNKNQRRRSQSAEREAAMAMKPAKALVHDNRKASEGQGSAADRAAAVASLEEGTEAY